MKITKIGLYLILGSILLSSCATIIGGSKYFAHVSVVNHPNASIEYKRATVGKGNAVIKVNRTEADLFSLTVKEENCPDQTFNFKRKAFRTGAFIGTLFGWTGLYNGFPLPWGAALDFASGALWKPDITENGITKIDYKHYNYILDYTGCKKISENNSSDTKSKTDNLRELKKLLDDGVLNQVEYEKEKKKILDEEK